MNKRGDSTDAIITVALLYLAWKAWQGYSGTVVPALERAGVKAYETIHREPAQHARDLPGHQWTKARLIELARNTGFPDPNMAAAIALAESGGVPRAKGDFRNGEWWSWGLWQINIHAHPHYGADEMMIPERNAHAAFQISKGGTNWNPWSVYKSGRYKRFL